jgi:hypothetical protein
MLRALALAMMAAAAVAAPPPKAPARQIKVPVWVNGSGAVKPADLSASLEGAKSRVLDVKGPDDDLLLLLVLDLASEFALAEPAKQALISAVEALPEHAFVGLLRAQDGLHVLVDPTGDRAEVANAIRDLPVSGKAGLLGTVEPMQSLADSVLAKSDVRVAVLYVTDSEVENYREDFTNPVINQSDSRDLSRRFPDALIRERMSKLEAALQDRQAPLFMVHLRYRSDRLNEAYQSGLKGLAEATAGTAVFCRSSAEIGEAVRQVFGLIASHYSVTLAVPARARKSVQVQLQADGSNLNYRTRFVLKER